MESAYIYGSSAEDLAMPYRFYSYMVDACKIKCSCEMQPAFATFSSKLLYKAPRKPRVIDYFEHFEVLIRKSHHQ